jgi:uroporphyrinogen-III synthase
MPYAVATREPGRAAPYLEALAALGLTGLAMPVTVTAAVDDLAPLAQALASLRAGDLVVVASARASELVAAQLALLPAAPSGVSWWAVGASSAAPLSRLGHAVATAARASAAGVAEEILRGHGAAAVEPARALAGRRVLLPRAEEGRDEAALALRAAGARVDELVVYRTVPRSPPPATAASPHDAGAAADLRFALERWGAAEVAVAALFAPSQVAALERLLASRGLSLAGSPALFAAIGDTTAAALRAAGVARVVVASAPTPEAMANAVASRYPTER